MKIIEIENLSIEKGGNKILDNINLSVEENDIIGVIGASGAGKSALMYTLRGMEEYRPTAGHIYYNIRFCENCERVDTPSRTECPRCGSAMELQRVDFWEIDKGMRDVIKRRVAIMFQEATGIYSMRSVIENVLAALHSSDYPIDARMERAHEIVKIVSLEHRIKHIARDLSGGEKQRVVMARQIAKDPMVLLLDEPTGTLDPKSSEEMYDVIKEISKERTTFIASHLTSYIPEVAPRSILLIEGRAVFEGETSKVMERFIAERRLSKKQVVNFEGEPIIQCRDLRREYFTVDEGVIKALDGVSLDIYEGEIHGILGHSGAGKTTLVTIINGDSSEFEGVCTVRLNGERVDMRERGIQRGRVKEKIAILHQEYGLSAYQTVYRNMQGFVPGVPEEILEEKIYDVLELVGFSEERIEGILKRYPDELSEGEKHRIIFASIILKDPKIMILDEPTGTLDEMTMYQITNSIINRRNEHKTTFLIVSHDLEFVRLVCDRVTVMDKGKAIFTGDTDTGIEYALKSGII